MSFFKIEMKADVPKTLDMYIYSDVQPDWYDWHTDEIVDSETSAEHFRKELEKAGNIEQINIYINSLGGSVMEGFGIYNQLRRHKAHKTVYIDGFACSIASVIAMAGDEIIMPSSAMMMIHAPLMCACGNASQLRKIADELDKISLSTMQAYLQKAGGKLTAEQLADMYVAEKYWSAAECIKMGLADRMADSDIDINAAIEALSDESDAGGSAENAKQQLIEKAKKAATAHTAASLAAKAPEPPSVNPPNVEQVGAAETVGDADRGKADFLASANKILSKYFM